MEEIQFYRTYKFYDEKGRRLSIFAIPNKGGSSEEPKNILKIYVITCSKHDVFSKKVAKNMFKNYVASTALGFKTEEVHPQEFVIDYKEGKAKIAFIEWCKANYSKILEYGMMLPGELVKTSVGSEDILGNSYLLIKCRTNLTIEEIYGSNRTEEN